MRRMAVGLVAVAMLGSACGGGGDSRNADERACAAVEDALTAMGSVGVPTAEWTTKLEAALDAATRADDPKVRAAATTAKVGATSTTAVGGEAASTNPYARARSLSDLRQTCAPHLR